MKIIYLVRSRSAEEMESWGPLAREQARLGYEVRIYPWFQPKQLAPLLLQAPPAVLHLVGPPRFPLHRLSALKSAHPFTLILEAPGPEPGGFSQNLAARAGRRRGGPRLGQVIAGGVARNRADRLALEGVWGLAGSQILCLSPGVDASRFNFNPAGRRQWRERLGLGGEALCVQVGPLYSLAAARRILTAGRNLFQQGRAVLALSGENPAALRQMLQAQARQLGVLNRIKFLEKISPDDLPGLYSAADLGVGFETDLPAQAAAMACRLPVVPPAEHLLAWWRDPEPWSRRRPGEAGGLESTLTRLVAEPGLRQELGERLRRLIEAESDWPVQARRLCHWYRELASAGAAPAAEPAREQLAA